MLRQNVTSPSEWLQGVFMGSPEQGRDCVQVYPDMHEVEMGDPVREQPGAKNFSVNLKGGRKLELP